MSSQTALAILLPDKKLWILLNWRLGGCWSRSGFWRTGSSVVTAKILTPDLPAYPSYIDFAASY
jgi:hypothetical protein